MKIPTTISRTVARQVLLAQKNSPTLLFGAGIGGTIGSTVLACRATLKLHEVIDEIEQDTGIAKVLEHEDYSETDRKKDLTIIYVRGIGKIGKLYAPSIVLSAVSIGALTKSHNILNERNVALTAAYAAVDKAFAQYRERVVDKYGEDQDREFRFESEKAEIIDSEGNRATVVRASPMGENSMYARFFDEYSSSWSKEPEYNLLFLVSQQNWCNDLLRSRGHIFLNEVYDALGLTRSKAGSVVGWTISHDHDNFIDFGVFDHTGGARDFVNGREGSILLDFNVDGVIYDKITDHGERIAWQS